MSTWQPPARGFWEGRWRDGARSMTVHDPEDGRVVGEVVDATAEETRAAIGYLVEHWAPVSWPLWQRRESLERAARLLSERAEQLAAVVAAEGCKTIAEARREAARAAETLAVCARSADELEGGTVPFGDTPRGTGFVGWWTREPIGLVAAITPFNDPLNLVAHKLGPALLAGNAVVLKPAQQTPLSGFALAALLLECGVPGSHLAVLAGHEVGPALVADPRVDVVSFTGGPTTADRIAAAGPARKLLMELGGNNAVIACDDADPARVAEAVVDGAFGVAGQNCLSVQRVFVAGAIYEEVLARVVDGAKGLVVGSKQDPTTDVGPMISEAEARRVVTWVSEAVAAGATLHTGGERTGSFVSPAVLTGVPRDARLRQQEVFGPVVVLEPFDDVRSAVAAVNEVDTGLQAGVFTDSIDLALAIASELRVGAVMINESSDVRIDAMPFGGFKRSGIGREGLRSALRELSEPKIVAVRRTDPLGGR